jgi:DNA-binding response OmpR family regulator
MAKLKETPIKILLAEKEDNSFLFKKALAEANINAKLTTVKDGYRLMRHLAVADKNFPDIIFLTINLQHQNGKQCLREIRGNKKFQKIPVIMFSSSINDMEIAETFAGGANLYVAKPIFLDDCVKILKKIFSGDWKEDLLKRNMKMYVMREDERSEKKV